MRKFTLVALLFLSFRFSYTQEVAVDSKGEPIFQLYSFNDARIQFNRRVPLSASYVFPSRQTANNSGTLLQFSILNSGDFPLVNKLRDIRPGAGIKLGYQHMIRQFNEVDQSNKNATHTWGINAFFNADNIKLYDTTKGIAEKRYPLTYGAEGNYVFFFRNKKQNSNWKKALSIYSSVSSSWNDRNLLSYQQVSKITMRPDVIAMQDFDGRYGALRENFFKYRMAISFPMFYKRFNPTPYWAAIFGTQNSPSYHMGVFTNVLSSSLKKSNTKLPSTFGFGFDWVYATEHLPAKVNLFMKLAVSFGKLKEE
ncbi:MAG TPA: hypothetical protein VNT20_10380 [Flavisolibacter sp.]|nr:hypothetical protein [Flavisolibacter sp.]